MKPCSPEGVRQAAIQECFKNEINAAKIRPTLTGQVIFNFDIQLDELDVALRRYFERLSPTSTNRVWGGHWPLGLLLMTG